MNGEKAREKRGLLHFYKNYMYLVLCFGCYLVLDTAFRLGYCSFGITPFLDKIPIVFTLSWCLLLTGIVWILPRLIKRIFMIFSMVVYSVLALVHCGMASFFGKFFSFSTLVYTGDGLAFFELSYITIRKIVIAAVIACVGVMIFAAVIAPKERYSKSRVICAVAAFAVGVGGINAVERLWLSEDTYISFDNYARNNALYESFTDTRRCLPLTGLYQYTFRDFCMTSGVYSFLDGLNDGDTIAELDAYYAAKETDADNEMTGVFEGKNLILIQLEAIDTWLITEKYMPNLYAIQQDSINFVNHYAPMYIDAGTFNTENIANTGLASPFIGGSTTIFSRNEYPYSLAHLLRNEGYTANSFHSSGAEVYSRGDIHANWGYESYHSRDDIQLDYPNSDSEFLKAYDLMAPEGEKFFTFYVTISGHGPYANSWESELHRDFAESVCPEGSPENYICAVSHAYETDLAIGILFDKLEEDGLLENTVVAFYADHYDYYVLDNNIIMNAKGVYDTNLIQSTPFFIWSADKEPMRVEKVTSSIDILPTLVNLFGLDTDGRYYVGNDAFSDNGGYVFFADYSWYDGTTYWNSSTDAADSEFIKARNSEIKTRLRMSWDTMNTDYFAHLG